MENTARGNRLHIGFYGKTNSGKSTLLNKLTNQNVSIVSEQKGTTTDVVYKPMELQSVGAVVFMDTAGIDDLSELGKQRVEKTIQSLEKVDVAVIVCDYNGWSEEEIAIVNKLKDLKTNSILAVITKSDLKDISLEKLSLIQKYTSNIVITGNNDENFITNFNTQLIKAIPENLLQEKTITGNLVFAKDTVILVIPIDKEAPKGRLILPQVQVLRELLDKNVMTYVVKESELTQAIENLKENPKLVITDSQAFKKVADIVPSDIPLTSFSILFANYKGDLKTFVDGAYALAKLNNGDKILFLESCSHHPIEDDIARVKIPKLLEKKTGKTFEYSYHSGCSLPDDLSQYNLIIHCGACMTNSKEVLSRILIAQKQNIPITNYGVIISYCLGILDRTIEPLCKEM